MLYPISIYFVCKIVLLFIDSATCRLKYIFFFIKDSMRTSISNMQRPQVFWLEKFHNFLLTLFYINNGGKGGQEMWWHIFWTFIDHKHFQCIRHAHTHYHLTTSILTLCPNRKKKTLSLYPPVCSLKKCFLFQGLMPYSRKMILSQPAYLLETEKPTLVEQYFLRLSEPHRVLD